MNRFCEVLKRERGVTVTEFAILAPMFFLLILTIIEGGRIFSTWMVITAEARDAARYGIVRYGDPSRQPTLVQDVQTRVRSRVGSTMSTDPTHFAVVVKLNQADPSLSVTIDYRVDILTPLVQSMIPNPFPLRAVSVMRAE